MKSVIFEIWKEMIAICRCILVAGESVAHKISIQEAVKTR